MTRTLMTRRVAAWSLALLPFGSAGCSTSPLSPSAPPAAAIAQNGAAAQARGGRTGAGVIFVTSQNLYYDTFVVKDPLPMKGPFQLLTNGTTEFGPGDPGYVGGRWWEDLNQNGVQDTGDHFFLCPLLPPGRPTP